VSGIAGRQLLWESLLDFEPKSNPIQKRKIQAIIGLTPASSKALKLNNFLVGAPRFELGTPSPPDYSGACGRFFTTHQERSRNSTSASNLSGFVLEH